jgi:uncharacterized membrane protein
MNIKNQPTDTAVDRRGYKTAVGWRIAAGILAGLGILTCVEIVRTGLSAHWRALVASIFACFLLVVIAATGRLPPWMDPGRTENPERRSRE